MSASTESLAGTAVRTFTVPVSSEPKLEAPRARFSATLRPDPELIDDFSQGVQLTVMQELARYWVGAYDLRRYESRLSALPNFAPRSTGWTSTPSTSARRTPTRCRSTHRR